MLKDECNEGGIGEDAWYLNAKKYLDKRCLLDSFIMPNGIRYGEKVIQF